MSTVRASNREANDVSRPDIPVAASVRPTAALLAFLLAGCGGGGGGGDNNPLCDPPIITSSPPTVASAEQDYSYAVTAPHFCLVIVIPGTCQAAVEPVQLPAGAQITNNGHTVSWTPTVDQANTNAQFAIVTKEICGGRSSQSWTVRVDPSAIVSFSAASTLLNPSESATLTAVFNGSGSIQGGNSPIPITSGVPLATAPIGFSPRDFTLVVTNAGRQWRRTISVDVRPVVMATSPANGETGTAINRALTATFNKLMDVTSINSATFLLRDINNNSVSGTVAYANGLATFAPAVPLTPATSYTATITTAVRDVAGNQMTSDSAWTFTTGIPDVTAPAVISTFPADGANAVAPEEFRLMVTFSEPIDPSSVNSATFVLKDSSQTTLNGLTTITNGGAAAEFRPSSLNLQPMSSYTASVTTGIRDLAGNPLSADHSWTFFTKAFAWRPTSTANAPSARHSHTAVWTGNEMIIWGGFGGDRTVSDGRLDSGGRYSAANDTWLATPTTTALSPRSNHTAVWTGSEMIIWGGLNFDLAGALGSGARYNPVANAWVSTAANGAPNRRYGHTAVWTGTEMIIWGGYTGGPANDPSSFPSSGARYNPSTDTWQPISTVGAPAGRWLHSAVWTGTEMIVWGGSGGSSALASGGRYNPGADAWAPTSTTGAPSARYSHTAVWSGGEMIIWGGGGSPLGSRYEPVAGAWTALPTAEAPTLTAYHSAIWSGSEMIVWGGTQGGRYNSTSNAWTPTTRVGAPAIRFGHTAVWTGTEMIIWGGNSSFALDGSYFFTGGRYQP